MAADTIPARLFAQAQRRPYEAAFFVKVDGAWRGTRWREFAEEVRRAARALVALGVGPGDSVGLLGFNRPDWSVLYLAAMSVGAAPVGVYTTCSAEEVAYILAHAESSVLLLEDAAQWAKVQRVFGQLPRLRRVVMYRGAAPVDDPRVQAWEDFLASGEGADDAEIDRRVAALEPAGLATLIYTSGTTGPPKGVMLSHENLAWTAETARRLTDAHAGQTLLSYLPLSHIAEQMLTIHGAVTVGLTVYYASALERLPEELKEVQPDVFFGVPRVWEKFYAAVRAKLDGATGAKRHLLAWARWSAARYHQHRNRDAPVPDGVAAQYRLAQRLVFSKLKPALGLGNATICVSGAAPVGREVLEFFESLDLPIREIYGQSEDTGPTSFNMPRATRYGTVGRPVAGVTVRIADDGEVMVRGPNVFLGYFKDPDATAATLREGWLASGDLGALDDDGYLKITGRKKEIIITSGGKNITPTNIEALLKQSDLVAEAVVVGDRRPYLVALLVPSPEGLARLARQEGLDAEVLRREAATHPVLREALQSVVDRANAHLARVETVKKFAVLPRALDIEHGELTPSMKVKRAVVVRQWADTLDALYAE